MALTNLSSAVKIATDAANTATAQANVAEVSAKAAAKSALTSATGSGSSSASATSAAQSATRAQQAEGAAAGYASDAAGQVALAAAQANTAGTSATQADAARLAAELARDAAVVVGPKYADEATGRAAVANGVTFLVQGAGDVAAFEYVRVSAGVSTLIATYPAKAYVDSTRTIADSAKKSVTATLIPRPQSVMREPDSVGWVVGTHVIYVTTPSDAPVDGVLVRLRPRGPGGFGHTVAVIGTAVIFDSAEDSEAVTGGDADALAAIEARLPSLAASASPRVARGGPRLVEAIGGQIFAAGASGYGQISNPAFTWRSPVVGAFGDVRCIRNDNKRASILPNGLTLLEGSVLLHKVVTGQSLSIGSRGFYPATAATPGAFQVDGRWVVLYTVDIPPAYDARALSLVGGPRPAGWVGSVNFIPTREYYDGDKLGETIASSWELSFINWLDRFTGLEARALVSVSGAGGQPYATLKKGTAKYDAALTQVQAAFNICTAQGLQHVVPSVSIIHGESQTATTQAQYVGYLAEWIADYRTDIVAITGQTVAPVAFISQMTTGEAGTIPAIPLAQLEAHVTNPNVCLIGPKYQLPYWDVYHLWAEGYVKLGEFEQRAERFHFAGFKWEPLRPVSHSVAGNTVRLVFGNDPLGHDLTPGPVGRLAFDTSLVTDPGYYGFTATGAAVEGVRLGLDGVSVEVDLSSTAPGVVLSYALQPTLGSPDTGNGRRGNLRDTDVRDVSRFDGSYLYNYAVAFAINL